jgi:hypothetical protein
METHKSKEIKRKKIAIPPAMTTRDIMKKYGLSANGARGARRKGFFVKNYAKKQIIIDESNYDVHTAYGIVWKIFWKNFSKNPVAFSIKDDLVQEGVTRMYELSGKADLSKGYSLIYFYHWVCHNAMQSFLKTWIKQMRYYQLFENLVNPLRTGERRRYHPSLGWMYC